MWAYKAYNPNAPEPPGKVSADTKPELPPHPTPKFSFRSLFGRYNDSGSLRREVSRLISPTEPDGEEEEGDSPRGRSRKVSFSSNTSNRRSRSRRSRSSSLFSSFGSNFSESKSEIMLAEILELLKEIKDERKGSKKGDPDDSDGDGTDHEGGPTDRRSRRRKSSRVGSAALSNGISAMETSPSEVTPYDDIASKASSAAKLATIAAGKEYVKHKLPGGGKNKQDPKKAAALAAVASLKESLGSDIKAEDILSELPSLGGMEGLQELLKAYQGGPESGADGDLAHKTEQVQEAGNENSRPESSSGLVDLLARLAALKRSGTKKPKRPRMNGSGSPPSAGGRTDPVGGKKPPTDKHSWDMKSAPQAFDWPSKEEIDRNNTATSPPTEVDGTRGLNRDAARSAPQLSENEGGRPRRSVLPEPPRGRTFVDLPSPGASTAHSDFDEAANREGPDDAYDIVFPTTPLHEPGLHHDISRTGLTQAQSGATETRLKPSSGTRPRLSALHPSRKEIQLKASNKREAAEPATKGSAGLHTRVAASLGSCLAILKDLGVGHHSRNPDSLSSTYEESVLAWLGVWFSKQLPAYERAMELFNHADTETQLDSLDCLAKLGVLLEHPGLSEKSWDFYLENQVIARGSAVKTAFLNMARSAVLGYLQQTLVSFDDSVVEIIADGENGLTKGESGIKGPMDWVPELSRALQDCDCGEAADVEIRDEAMGLLDILRELTSDISHMPKVAPAVERGPNQPEIGIPSIQSSRHAAKQVDNKPREEPESSAAAPRPQTTLQNELSAPASGGQQGEGEAARYFDMDPNTSKREAPNKPFVTSRSVNETDAQARPAESLEQYEASRQEQMMPMLTSARRAGAIQPSQGRSTSSKQSSARSSDGKMPKSVDPSVLRRRLEGVRARPSKTRDASRVSTGSVTDTDPAIDEQLKRGSNVDRADQGATSRQGDATTSYFPPGETTGGDEVKVRPGPVTQSVAGSTTHAPTRSSPLKKAMSPLDSPLVLGQQSMGGSATQRPRGDPIMEGMVLPPRTSQDIGQPDPKAHSQDVTQMQQRPKPEALAVSGSTESQPEQPALPDMQQLEVPTTQAIAPSRPASMLLGEQEPKSETDLSFDSDTQTTETISDKETRVEQTETEQEATEAIQEAREKNVDVDEPIGANQILTSADILSGRYGGLKPSQEEAEALTSETEDSDEPISQTRAEQAFQQAEVEEEDLDALVPAPKVITSKDIRDRRYNYQDFPRTLRSAVPRVETHPGAITSATTGEIVLFAEEHIHLSAGETLVDGTGRMWNEEGLVEPGKDDEGKFIVYDVDIAQIKREYGRVPAILPWESFELDTPPESPSESFQTGDDWSGSEASVDPSGISTPATPAGRRPSMRVLRSEEADIERQLQYNGQDRLSFVEEDDDDDHPLDDLEVAALEEGEEKETAATPGPAPGFGPFDGVATPY